MKRSEMILAGGFLVVVVGYFAGPPLLNLVTGSSQQLQARQTELNRELAQLKKLNRWKHQSLAAPEGTAADRAEEQYRNWVWSLAESVGKFDELMVAPTSRGSRRARGFVPVQVQLKGVARYGDIQRFLYHFYQADLLHRVVSLRMESKSQDHDPKLDVTLVAEGLSLPFADVGLTQRDSLFPHGRLASESDDGTVSVAEAEGFPVVDANSDGFLNRGNGNGLLDPDEDVNLNGKLDPGEDDTEGFLIRVGDQYLEVTSNEKQVDSETGTKTVLWGYESVSPEKTLAEGATVELVKVADSMQKVTLDDYKLVNPFARYEPQLIVSGRKSITVGESFGLTARVDGMRPGIQTTFELGRHPSGMTIDKQTGAISWKTEKGQPPGKTTVEILAKLEGREAKLSGSPTSLEWKAASVPVARNESPTVGALQAITVVAGSVVEFVVSGSDPEKGELDFALASGAPAGATIDAKSGQFRWVPQAPGEFKVTVEVGDDGDPPKKGRGSVTIQVSLDSAQFTILTASIIRDGEPQAWLFDRLKNQRLVLRPKSRFRYGKVEAEVVSIEQRAVVFRIGKEEHRLALGESLQKLKPKPKPYDEDPKPPKPASDVKAADAKPADTKPTDVKPADAKPTDTKPTDAKPADAKPADAKPADAKPADAKPADAKPADAKPASDT